MQISYWLKSNIKTVYKYLNYAVNWIEGQLKYRRYSEFNNIVRNINYDLRVPFEK